MIDSGRLGHNLLDEIAGSLFENTCGFAGHRIVEDFSIRRVGSGFGDAGKGERFGIGPVGVLIIALEKDSENREDFVEIYKVRESFRGEHGVVPAAAQNPGIIRMLFRILAETGLDFRDILGALKIDLTETEAPFEEMDVAIGEAGENKFSAGVDHPGADAAHPQDDFFSADGDNFSIADSQTIRPGPFVVVGVNFGVDNDDVRGRVAHGLLGAAWASEEHKNQKIDNGKWKRDPLVRRG